MRKKKRKKNESKTCSLCGKDMSKWNLEFKNELLCGTCFFPINKDATDIDRTSDQVEISVVKKLFDAVEAREIVSPYAISCLERATHHDFKNTKDFRVKMNAFLKKHYYKGTDLRETRKWAGFEQDELGDLFNVSKHQIKQMEVSKQPLSKDAIDFIRVMGGEKKVTLKKPPKSTNEYYPTCKPNLGYSPPERICQKSKNSALNNDPKLKQFTKEEAFPHLYGELK